MSHLARPGEAQHKVLDTSLGLVRCLGCLFGSFLLAGGVIGVGAVGYEALVRKTPAESPLVLGGVVLVGLALFGAGLVLVGLRTEMALDRASGIATTRLRVFGWRHTTSTRPLADFTEVRLVREEDGVASGSPREARRLWTDHAAPCVMYVARLVGKGDPVMVASGQGHQFVRETAEEYAKFLRVGLRDSGQGEESFRAADALDESLRERSASGRPVIPLGPPPAGTKIRLERTLAGTRIALPAPGFHAEIRRRLIAIVVSISCVAGFFSCVVLLVSPINRPGVHPSMTPFLVGIAALALVGVIGIALAVRGALDSATRVDSIEVGRDGIRLTAVSRVRASSEAMTGDEIEEIVCGADPLGRAERGPASGRRSRDVIIRGDARTIRVGRFLTDAELAWLRDLLRDRLAGGG